jgi:rare lipoprotein A (peptidoglycan hydrolase)
LLALTALVALGVAPLDGAVAASPGGVAAPSGGAGAATVRPHATKARVPSRGIATWFGPGFYGNQTGCGQTLTPQTVGVANRTLPCGTLVKVTYGSHALTLPVLDRGPYSHIGADWDLTAGAAVALGITETVRIGTRVVGSTPNTPMLGTPPAAQTAGLSGGALAG